MPVLPLSSLPARSDVYIDANIFVYAMLGKSSECRALFARCETDVFAYSDIRVLHDASHQVMLAEAAQTAPKWGSPKNLKTNPTLIRSLTRWQQQVRLMRGLSIEWINLSLGDISNVPQTATSSGLLCGDALHLSIMQSYGITMIVSNDADFAAAGLAVYKPGDV